MRLQFNMWLYTLIEQSIHLISLLVDFSDVELDTLIPIDHFLRLSV